MRLQIAAQPNLKPAGRVLQVVVHKSICVHVCKDRAAGAGHTAIQPAASSTLYVTLHATHYATLHLAIQIT